MKLFFYLLTLFILIPSIELMILLYIAGAVGALKAFILIIVTGVIGAHLAKQQGLRVIRKIRDELTRGRIPGTELVDGLIILISGIVLITPGLLSDITGFLLLLPVCRKLIYRWVLRKFREKIHSAQVTFHAGVTDNSGNEMVNKQSVIDVETTDRGNGHL